MLLNDSITERVANFKSSLLLLKHFSPLHKLPVHVAVSSPLPSLVMNTPFPSAYIAPPCSLGILEYVTILVTSNPLKRPFYEIVTSIFGLPSSTLMTLIFMSLPSAS